MRLTAPECNPHRRQSPCQDGGLFGSVQLLYTTLIEKAVISGSTPCQKKRRHSGKQIFRSLAPASPSSNSASVKLARSNLSSAPRATTATGSTTHLPTVAIPGESVELLGAPSIGLLSFSGWVCSVPSLSEGSNDCRSRPKIVRSGGLVPLGVHLYPAMVDQTAAVLSQLKVQLAGVLCHVPASGVHAVVWASTLTPALQQETFNIDNVGL